MVSESLRVDCFPEFFVLQEKNYGKKRSEEEEGNFIFDRHNLFNAYQHTSLHLL